jgi:hypothetical protein
VETTVFDLLGRGTSSIGSAVLVMLGTMYRMALMSNIVHSSTGTRHLLETTGSCNSAFDLNGGIVLYIIGMRQHAQLAHCT